VTSTAEGAASQAEVAFCISTSFFAMIARCLSVLPLVFFFVGCSHLHPWATDRDMEGSYDQVFRATLEVLEDKQFPINEVDRAEGRIVTGKRPVRVIEAYRRVETVRARLDPEGGAVDVQLFLTFMDQSGTVRHRAPNRTNKEAEAVADKMLSSSTIYDDYLDAIEQRVRDLQAETGE
jgi:hypothetical protein